MERIKGQRSGPGRRKNKWRVHVLFVFVAGTSSFPDSRACVPTCKPVKPNGVPVKAPTSQILINKVGSPRRAERPNPKGDIHDAPPPLEATLTFTHHCHTFA